MKNFNLNEIKEHWKDPEFQAIRVAFRKYATGCDCGDDYLKEIGRLLGLYVVHEYGDTFWDQLENSNELSKSND